jgi:hypothetical protein
MMPNTPLTPASEQRRPLKGAPMFVRICAEANIRKCSDVFGCSDQRKHQSNCRLSVRTSYEGDLGSSPNFGRYVGCLQNILFGRMFGQSAQGQQTGSWPRRAKRAPARLAIREP